MDHGCNLFIAANNVGVDLGSTGRGFRERFRKKHRKDVEQDLRTASREWATMPTPGTSHTWADLKLLQQRCDHGPIVLQGISTVQGTKKAVGAGMQGILVSGHGGRQ